MGGGGEVGVGGGGGGGGLYGKYKRWQVMWNFKANTSEMAKKISSGQENLRFQMLSCTQSGIQRSPLELEAQRFSKYLTADEISGAALCKARQKIKYTAFEELFEQTAASAPKDKRFHGYHLYAVDGMKGELPKNSGIIRKILRN